MIIEHSAFKNCSSLEELNFSKNTELVQTNITPKYDVPDICKVVVPNKLYDSWKQAECQYSKNFIISVDDFVTVKLNNKKFGKIAASIIYMQKAIPFLSGDVALQLKTYVKNIIEYLCIDNDLLKEAEQLINMKETETWTKLVLNCCQSKTLENSTKSQA